MRQYLGPPSYDCIIRQVNFNCSFNKQTISPLLVYFHHFLRALCMSRLLLFLNGFFSRSRKYHIKSHNIRDMNLYQAIAILLLVLHASATYTNTTEFWQKQLNATSMNYQCYSGFEEINWYYPSGKSGMFYNMFTSYGHNPVDPDPRIPLILWLQGGPGSSSQFGAFTENGPIKITKDKIKEIGYSWNIIGHTVFIDQPLGVGFSYLTDQTKKPVRSARDASEHLLNFLYNFYTQWPALKKSPLYITGESFAGHYIPAFAQRIVNNRTFLNDTKIVLEGVAIGDGWTDPYNQINQYDSYLYSVGVVANKFRETCTWFQSQAIYHMMRGDNSNATKYFDFLTNNDETRYTYWGGMSTYNFRQYGQMDTTFASFLNESRKSFGVDQSRYYIPGSDDVYNAFAADISRSYVGDLIYLLKNGIRVLIYNGQDDFVVNTPGVINYLNSLNWVGTAYWKRAPKQIWTVHGEVKGWAKVYNNLWFVLVNHAGHMVPTDQPEAAFNMLGHFIFDHREWNQ